MKKIIVFLSLLSFYFGFSTAQRPDYLIIGKDTLKIQCNPLEDYFNSHPMPQDSIQYTSSANWRGYVAYFKIIDNKLVVENIYKERYDYDNRKLLRTSIYRNIFGEMPNFSCDFYSGLLICPSGKMLEYIHMGYSSIYENYDLFEVKNGVVTNSKKMTHEEFIKFKVDYFKYYKTTDEYKNEKIKLQETFKDINNSVEEAIDELEGTEKRKKKKKNKKENLFFKQKEQEYETNKRIDEFLFLFLSNHIKTIDIPIKN